MSKTRLEVCTKALQVIGVVAVGENASAEDFQAAAEDYDSLFASLDTVHEIGVSFTSDAVPEWAYLPLAHMVGGSVCLTFDREKFVPLFRRGLRDLKRFAANENRVDGRPVKTVYY